MPVTIRLSKLVQDRFGEEIADELVNWFNQVDATYRTDLRELNELNFARFDAKLEQRVASLDAKIDQRAAALDSRIDQRTATLEAKIDQRVAELRERISEVKSELLKWMFIFWAGTVVPLAGLMIALRKL